MSGLIIVVNGEPRSGKSTLAAAIGSRSTRPTTLLGVDDAMSELDEAEWPGIGLRPGGERPDLEPAVADGYRRLWADVTAAADRGDQVVVDVGLHRDYATGIDPWAIMRAALVGRVVYVIGVRCALDEILRRRAATGYLSADAGEPVPPPVLRWHHAVHDGADYDIIVDTTSASPGELAEQVLRFVAG